MALTRYGNCEICNGRFTRKKGQWQRYCRYCAHKVEAERDLVQKRNKTITRRLLNPRACENCNKDITLTKATRFCSSVCRSIVRNRTQYPIRSESLTCLHCGSEKSHIGKFCSISCQKEAANKRVNDDPDRLSARRERSALAYHKRKAALQFLQDQGYVI